MMIPGYFVKGTNVKKKSFSLSGFLESCCISHAIRIFILFVGWDGAASFCRTETCWKSGLFAAIKSIEFRTDFCKVREKVRDWNKIHKIRKPANAGNYWLCGFFLFGGVGETRTLAPLFTRPTPLAGAPRHQLEYYSMARSCQEHSILIVAERVGFEPTVACTITSFQDWLLKPLGHLSIKNTLFRGCVSMCRIERYI